jgi:hypothetical protein
LLGDDPSPRVRHQVAKFLVARSEALS